MVYTYPSLPLFTRSVSNLVDYWSGEHYSKGFASSLVNDFRDKKSYLHGESTIRRSVDSTQMSSETTLPLKRGIERTSDSSQDLDLSFAPNSSLMPRSRIIAEIGRDGRPGFLMSQFPAIRIASVTNHIVFFLFGMNYAN